MIEINKILKEAKFDELKNRQKHWTKEEIS